MGKFLTMLSQSSDANLKFLATRIDFNEQYARYRRAPCFCNKLVQIPHTDIRLFGFFFLLTLRRIPAYAEVTRTPQKVRGVVQRVAGAGPL